MVITVPPRYIHRDSKQRCQPLDLQNLIFRSICNDLPPAHQEDTLDLRNDVGQFVGCLLYTSRCV